MPAYDRYCDIHVTQGENYDFTSEIAEQCRYQTEHKKQCVIGKKALIAMDYLPNWHLPAITLLKHYPNGMVVAEDRVYKFAVGKIASIWALNRAAFGGKKLLVDEDEKGFVSKMHDDDVVSEATNGFSGYVLKKLNAKQLSLTNWAKNAPAEYDPQILFSSSRNIDNLLTDKVGYLSLSVPMKSIWEGTKDGAVEKMLKWVTMGCSKIRISCHGDGEGNLEMGGSYMAADCIAKFLHANGLEHKGKLETIGLNLCMAARYKLTPAIINGDLTVPAEGSAVQILASALGGLGLSGIKVTGSNENVVSSPFTTFDPEFPSGGDIRHMQSRRIIDIPTDFEFDKPTYTMTIPKGWTLRPKGDGALCVIKAPADFVVSTTQSTYQAIQSDQSTKEVSQAYGMFQFKAPGSGPTHVFYVGWIVDQARKEATGANGWKQLDANRMQFVGTGGKFVLQTTGSSIKIVETLAHSKAKAFAIS